MSNLYILTDKMIRKEQKNSDKRAAALLMELGSENMLLPQSPLAVVKRVLKIYRVVKPVLSIIVKLPILPRAWSGILGALMNALDALGSPEVIDDISAKFKAGKDLDQAA